jgi:hypothetical protein
MSFLSFQPSIATAKNVTISASSQAVDIVSAAKQVRIVNTSTGAIAVNIGSSSATVTAAFTDGNGMIIPPGGVEIFTRPAGYDRYAVIGAIANGYAQITPGDGV